jgi:hypothetical protein
MSDTLLSTNIWSRITRAVNKTPRKCFVAVAYFATGASEMLPLKKGSLLVVNLSREAVKAGQTNPNDVLKLLNRGVSVNSVKNLHAKVFVANRTAFVGSTNASGLSANVLQEATLQTTNRSVVKQCREFVQHLGGEVVTPEYARQMKKLYRPPKVMYGSGQTGKRTSPLHEPLWLVPLVYEEWDAEAKSQDKAGLPKAKKKLRSSGAYQIERFHWVGLNLLKELRPRHILVQMTEEGGKTTMVSPAARVLHIQRYKKRRWHNAIVFLEVPKKPVRKNLTKVVSRLGPRAKKEFGKLSDPKLLRDAALAHGLLNFWPSVNGK